MGWFSHFVSGAARLFLPAPLTCTKIPASVTFPVNEDLERRIQAARGELVRRGKDIDRESALRGGEGT